jgi:hypothetical protein
MKLLTILSAALLLAILPTSGTTTAAEDNKPPCYFETLPPGPVPHWNRPRYFDHEHPFRNDTDRNVHNRGVT